MDAACPRGLAQPGYPASKQTGVFGLFWYEFSSLCISGSEGL